jgi:hypothetical protein
VKCIFERVQIKIGPVRYDPIDAYGDAGVHRNAAISV